MTDLQALVNTQIASNYTTISIETFNATAAELNNIYGINKTNTLLNDAFRYAITDTTCLPMQKTGVKINTIAMLF